MSTAMRPIVAKAILHTISGPNSGRLRDVGGERRSELVGVPCRLIVKVSVLLCAGSRGCGLKLQASQLGSGAFLSASRQEKVIGLEKPFTVTVKFAEVLVAVRLAVLGVIEPVGNVEVAKSISATPDPLA
jgi:hypothetical protein